jgi:hypothetical protein
MGGLMRKRRRLTNLPNLLNLCVPLGAVLVVFQGPELAEQQEDLGNDYAGEALRAGSEVWVIGGAG